MRRFVALGVDASTRHRLDAAIAHARARSGVAWTRPSGWHVTLAFCGQLDELDELVSAVRGAVAGWGPLELATAGLTTLSGRVAALAVEPAAELAHLGAAVQDAIAQAGLPVHRRRVAAHVTLARARSDRRAFEQAVEDLTASVPRLQWTARDVGVWRSQLGEGPARYVEEASLALGSD